MSAATNSYRERLAMLEKDLYAPPKPSFYITPLYLYPTIIIILFLLLSIFTPSFLYKKHKKKYHKSWTMIVLIWIVLSLLLCAGLYFYMNKI